jgi:hypothetical protein
MCGLSYCTPFNHHWRYSPLLLIPLFIMAQLQHNNVHLMLTDGSRFCHNDLRFYFNEFPELTDFNNLQGTECNTATNGFIIITENLIFTNYMTLTHAPTDATVFCQSVHAFVKLRFPFVYYRSSYVTRCI